MDTATVREIGVYQPPSTSDRSSMGSSISVTTAGDFFFADDRGQVQVASIRPSKASEGSGDRRVQTIPLPTGVNLSSCKHICTNTDASLICLWSEVRAVVLEIPHGWTKEGSFKVGNLDSSSSSKDKKTVVVKDLYDINAETEKKKIAKVAFHPANEHSIVILFETDKLMVFDVRNMQPQTFFLSGEHKFNSFSFGPNMEWLRFTIFLTTNTSKIFALCPVIPFGTLVPGDAIEELWSWLDDVESKAKPNEVESKKYIQLMKNYLLGMVGKRGVVTGKESYVVAGETDDLSATHRLTDGLNNNANITYASIHSIFDRNRVQLQGPLPFNQNSSSSASHTLCDITIPVVKYSDISPPVIVAVYSSGKAEVLLLDSKDSSAWFINPMWSTINASRQVPTMIVADAFSVGNDDGTKRNWKIIADPVFAHNFYLVDASSAEVYLISSGWLHTSLKSIAQALMTIEDEVSEGKTSSDAKQLVADRVPAQSQCLPIYAPSSSKLGPSKNLNGVFVVQDPFVGHIAYLRLDSKQLIAINITMHTKLCQLQMSIQDQYTESAGDLQRQFNKLMSSDNLIWRHAHGLLTQIAKGLKVLPTLEVTVNAESDPVGNQSDAQNKKFLLETVQLLEKNVILPMKELKDSILFHVNVVEQMYKLQQEMIEGRSNDSHMDNNSNHSQDLSTGLRGIIKSLMQENESIVQRLLKVEEKYQVLKDTTEAMLTVVYSRPKKASGAELLYQEQLNAWHKSVENMTKEIEIVRKLAKPAPKVYPLPDANELKKSQMHAFSSPPASNKPPSTPFSPLFSKPFPTPSNFNDSSINASPLKGFATPSSKSNFDISSSQINLSWSASKIQDTTPSKIGLNSTFKQSPLPPAQKPNQDIEVMKLSAKEEKACNDLLLQQSAVLSEAERKVRELEAKLQSMKLEPESSIVNSTS